MATFLNIWLTLINNYLLILVNVSQLGVVMYGHQYIETLTIVMIFQDHKECNCANNKKKSATKLIGESKSTTLVQSDTANEDLSEGEISKREYPHIIKKF